MQTSIRSLLSRAASSRVTGVAVALLAALGIVVRGLTAPTTAEVNPQIEATSLTLIKVNSANEQQDDQLHVKGLALLTFDWDTSKTTPKEGDSFTITLPEEMEFHSTLVVPMDYNGRHVGQCTFTEKIVTCTFDVAIIPLIQAGSKDIHGVDSFQLDVVLYTTQEELLFIVNHDETVRVDLPGASGIPKPSGGTYRPDMRLYKSYNGIMKEGDTQALRYFNFGGPRPMKALGVTFDGQTSHTITFNDTLGAGMTYPLQQIYLRAINLEENLLQSLLLDSGTKEGPTTGGQGTFEVTGKCGEMAVDGTTPITLVAKGPSRAKTNYPLSYGTLFVGSTAFPGTDYTSAVTVAGTQITESKATQFVKAGPVQVAIRQGGGTFSMTKRTAADYAQQVDAGMTFTVVFDYGLPTGTTTDSYPKWTSPVNEDNNSTPNADKRIGTATMVVKQGEEISFATPFPVGTTISNLREDTSTASPVLPAGYTWKNPKFTINTVAGTSLTIKDQKTTKVNLLNTMGAADNGFQVVKEANGTEGVAMKKFSFSYTCTLPDNTKKDGQIADVSGGETPVTNPEKFPVGTTCEVTEDTAGVGIDGYTLDPAGHDAQSVTIGMSSEPMVTATFTNTYMCDMGRSSVTKTAAGDAGDKASDTYTLDYTCKADGKDPITGTIIVGKDEPKKSDEVPVGYSHTVKERVDQSQDGTAYLEGYALDVVANPDVTIAKGAVPNVDVINIYTLNKGTFSVKKIVQGAAFTGTDNTFTVQYIYTYNSVALADEQKAGSLTPTGNGMAVTSPPLPFGTSCTIKEADGSARRASYAVATAYITGQVTVGTATLSPEVMVTNTYTPFEGGLDISKTVGGDGATLAKDKEFTFDYTCTPLTGTTRVKGTIVVKGGKVGVVTDVPAGSCLVSERDVTIDGASLSMVFTVDGSTNGVNNGTAIFDVRNGTTVKIAATNTYVLDRGSSSVAKTVVGGTDSFTRDTFVFDYVCTDGTEGRLDVLGDGTIVEGPRVPAGTECALTECAQAANREGYAIVSELSDSGKVTITDKDTIVAVIATNTRMPVPAPTPPGETLAKTGASNVLMLGVIGSVLALAGGVLVAAKRRRNQV